MGIKKSFSNSPLAEPKCDDSQYNFVEDQNPRVSNNTSSIFQYVDASSGMQLVDSFSEKVVRKAEEAKAKDKEAVEKATEIKNEIKTKEETKKEDNPVEKKIASYYISKQTLLLLKQFANQNKKSYSAVVEQAIINHLIAMFAERNK